MSHRYPEHDLDDLLSRVWATAGLILARRPGWRASLRWRKPGSAHLVAVSSQDWETLAIFVADILIPADEFYVEEADEVSS